MTTAAVAGSCWNCGQPVQTSAASCLWCGVAQQRAAQFVLAPGGGVGATSSLPSSAPSSTPVATQATPGAPSVTTLTAPRTGPVTGTTAVRTVTPLSPAFGGAAGGVGAQLAAFTVDVVLVAVVAAIVHVMVGEPLLTLIAVLEALIFMWIVEARTGATPGNLVVRLRTSLADAPYSPGVGRVALRHLITGAGFAILALGAWAVVASGAIDSSGRQRSLAARASGTQSVAVPRRTPLTSTASLGPQTGISMPTVKQPEVVAAPQVKNALASPALPHEDSVSMSMTGTQAGVTSPTPTPTPGPAAVAVTPAPPAPSIAPIPGAPASRVNLSDVDFGGAHSGDGQPAAVASASTLLLIFDTGQRETLPIPTAVNLGRKPAATEATDHLISVTDSEGTVSKTHVRLEHSGLRTWVTDQGSTNGTEILEDDGDIVRLSPHVRTEVPDGARVRMGNRTFTISALLDAQGAGS